MDRKVAIITGAAGGIGRKVVKKFLDKGYRAVMVDLNEQALVNAAQQEGFDQDLITCCPLDITDEEAVKTAIEKLAEKLGHLDVLVNTAGICGVYNETIDYEFANFRKIYEVNVFGTFLMIKYTLPVMLKQQKGSIVNFGSVSGMTGYKYEVGYGSSKAAVIALTQNVANEYGSRGIRVNSVSPGWVHTAMMAKTLDNYRLLGIDNPEEWIESGPIGRPAEPEEIADGVYFLCSEEAKYITGANLLIDGGMLLG